jgi:hypothetical protein
MACRFCSIYDNADSSGLSGSNSGGLLMERMDRMDPFMVIRNISAISYGFEIVRSGFLMERMERMDPFMVIRNISTISQ